MGTKPSTDLTVKSLEDSGIRTSISQNDLIDIVLQDKQDRILREVDRIDGIARGIAAKFLAIQNAQKEIFLEELQKLDSSVTVEQIHVAFKNRYNHIPINGVYFKEDANARVDNIYELGRASRGNVPSTKEEAILVLTCSVSSVKETETKGIQVATSTKVDYKKEFKIPTKTMNSLYKEIEALNKEAQDFINTFPSTRINMNKVTREIKNKLNKTILKNQAPELQAQMKKVFDIDL